MGKHHPVINRLSASLDQHPCSIGVEICALDPCLDSAGEVWEDALSSAARLLFFCQSSSKLCGRLISSSSQRSETFE